MNKSLLVLLLLGLAVAIIGCAAKEEEPSAPGATYYKGDMKPKGPASGAPAGGLAGEGA